MRPMEPAFAARVEAELNEIRESGLWKEERKTDEALTSLAEAEVNLAAAA